MQCNQAGMIFGQLHPEMLANQEVAESLGLTEAAASMRYLRAVRKLRAHLAHFEGATP